MRLKALTAMFAALTVVVTLTAVAAPAEASSRTRLTEPFGREVVRPGDADVDPYHIEHVVELQYRLKWLGLFHANPTGYFGSLTERAVKRFQRHNDLKATGVVNQRTWTPLIQQTIRGKRAVPHGCRTKGWHACYDRFRHQVNLYHGGELLNSWLVRGGDYYTPTRTGRFRVYLRNVDQVSTQFGNSPMPYSQFFSGGEALHGSRMMMDPFVGHSHGCVNFWTEDARQLWRLTSTKRLWVHVYGAWD